MDPEDPTRSTVHIVKFVITLKRKEWGGEGEEEGD